MHIHIDGLCVNVEINEIIRIVGRLYQLTVCDHYSFMKIRMAHIATIHKKILIGYFLGKFRSANKTGDGQQTCFGFNGQQLLIHFLPVRPNEDMFNSCFQGCCGQIHHLSIIVIQEETDIRMNEYYAVKFIADMGHLG